MTDRTTEVTGAVANAQGHPVADYSVIVFSDDPERWTQESRHVTSGQPDREGRFKIRSLPPGRYLAAAVESLEGVSWRAPDFLEGLRLRASAFTLGEAEARTLTLRLVEP